MKMINRSLGFYLISILLPALTITSLAMAVDNLKEGLIFFISSSLLLSMIFRYHYKMYLNIIGINDPNKITKGLFYSTLIGAVTFLVYNMYIAFMQQILEYGSVLGNKMILFTLVFIVTIYFIMAILMIIIDASQSKIKKTSIIGGSIIHYFTILLVNTFLFHVLTLLINGLL
jgi:hypothetical protein